ncbi:MAG: type II secretion system protein [Sedimentisphaerales bacterium]|jgi:prepilin-type N-terminal cleavage/methylation domain-containing protein|nr:type II secretion system protein [Sedimentisphaerales bacterium]
MKGQKTRSICPGFTLVEIVVVVSILGLFISLVSLNLFGALRRSSFKAIAQDLVQAMQTVALAATENGRYYELIIDLPEQGYLLREITNADLSEVLPEEIIQTGQFGPRCRLVYVQFDDGQSTSKDRAKFRVGPRGWQYGGKIVLADDQDQLHAILVNRLNRRVLLVEGDPELPMPVQPELMRF